MLRCGMKLPVQTRGGTQAAVSQELVGQLLRKAWRDVAWDDRSHRKADHRARIPGLARVEAARPFCSWPSSFVSVWHLMSSLGT